MGYSTLPGRRLVLRSKISVFYVYLLAFTLLIILTQNTTTWNILSRLSLKDDTPESRVARECAQFPTKEKIKWDQLYYLQDLSENKSLIWCQVPKVASSTLGKIFLDLAGAPDTGDYHAKLRKFYPALPPEVMTERLNTNFKFMVVRHPFDRILSAYREKLESCSRNPLFCPHGRRMVKRPVENGTTVEPTFQEFVTYLLETSPETYDGHWRPISQLCTPCNIQYDAIVRLENFDAEIKVPLRQAGIDEDIGWQNHVITNRSTPETYFQQLSFSQVNKIFDIYRKDFVLFGYSPEEYFSMVLPETAK